MEYRSSSKTPCHGIPSKLCTRISSFHSNRRISVVVSGHSSFFQSVNANASEGLEIAPISIFILNINDLFSTTSKSIHSYLPIYRKIFKKVLKYSQICYMRVTFKSNLNRHDRIQEHGFSFRAKKYLSSANLYKLYVSQLRSNFEQCSHIQGAAPQRHSIYLMLSRRR